jgi:hypothetical protein
MICMDDSLKTPLAILSHDGEIPRRHGMLDEKPTAERVVLYRKFTEALASADRSRPFRA